MCARLFMLTLPDTEQEMLELIRAETECSKRGESEGLEGKQVKSDNSAAMHAVSGMLSLCVFHFCRLGAVRLAAVPLSQGDVNWIGADATEYLGLCRVMGGLKGSNATFSFPLLTYAWVYVPKVLILFDRAFNMTSVLTGCTLLFFIQLAIRDP